MAECIVSCEVTLTSQRILADSQEEAVALASEYYLELEMASKHWDMELQGIASCEVREIGKDGATSHQLRV
jgi:hypothetical protein